MDRNLHLLSFLQEADQRLQIGNLDELRTQALELVSDTLRFINEYAKENGRKYHDSQ